MTREVGLERLAGDVLDQQAAGNTIDCVAARIGIRGADSITRLSVAGAPGYRRTPPP